MRSGASYTYHTTHSGQPTTTEGLKEPTQEAPLEHTALVTREKFVVGTHKTSPTNGYFSKIRKQNQHTRYIKTETWANEVTEEHVSNEGIG